MSVGSIRHRYRRLLGRNVAAEVDAELRFHFDMRVEELVAGGMTRDDARQAVLARLGTMDEARAECTTIDRRQRRREVRVEVLATLIQDLRQVTRSLSRQKAWTATAILTLALGIGATSALFTIVNAVMIRPLPYPDADRILSLSMSTDGSDMSVVPDYIYQAWRARSRSFGAIAAYTGSATVLQVGDEPEAVNGLAVSQPYFTVFGVRPERGRVFLVDEDVPGAPRVTVLSDQLWRHAFGADTTILGRLVLFDGVPYTVVGVMPPQFTTAHRAQYWVPLRMPATEANGSVFFYQIVGRLAAPTLGSALVELTEIAKVENASKGPDAVKTKPLLMTLRQRRLGDTSGTLLILLAAVGVLMLIACVNVSNLLLARAASRRRELSVRVALGASWWRLARFLLCEGLLLSVVGAGLGLAIASASVGYFARIGPPSVAQAEGLGLDWRVLAFTTALALLTGLVFGLLPAWAAMREDVSASISSSGGGGRNAGSVRQNRVRRALVVLELGTSLVLVTAAGLLSKSFFRVTSTASGAEPAHLLVADTRLSRSRYPNGAAGPFYDRLVAAVRAMPGVVSASITQAPPVGGARMSQTVTLADGSKSPRIWVFAVDDAYFATAGIPIVAGRGFLPSDVRNNAAVVVVSTSLARAIAAKSGGSVLGRVLKTDGETGPTIIGIAGDVRQQGLEADPTMQLYTSLAHEGADNYMTLLVRTTGDPAALIGPVRAIFHRIDTRQPMPSFQTMEQQMAEQVAPRRFRFIVLGLFAVLAATLAAVGLYGVMSYMVTERTNEIGVRVALGADRSRVMRLVVGEGMAMTAVAAALGLAGSVIAVRALRSMVFQVSVYDPWIFGISALVLGGVAIVACGFPAWRAAKVDPITALRAA